MSEPDAGLHAEAVRLLDGWTAPDPPQESLRQAYLAYLAARPDALRRACSPGHLTASALVCDLPHRRTLLTLHPRIGRWVQLGGHCEPTDATVEAAALREAAEESGIPDLTLRPQPLQLDVHPLTCSGGVPTRHLDVRFLALAASDSVEQISDESLALQWFSFDELPDLDASTRRLVRYADILS